MSLGLPAMAYQDGIRKFQTVAFKGLNHTIGAKDGELWDMQNLTADLYPVLSTRKPRYLVRKLLKPNGFYCHDGLYWVDGAGFYENGALKGAVSDDRKTFVSLGAYIVILPDKKYYNRLTGEFGDMESSVTASCTIQDGTYAGEEAAANTIYSENVNWSDYFKVGDAVEISGAQTHVGNNITIVIRELEGGELRFYENSFTVSEGGDAEELTIARKVPDMDFVCENENRLWGCKGDTIYASKLGDIFNWNVFDGISTDSYAVNVGSVGDFTACSSYLGYPCFFKEMQIYKVYGDKPSNYQVMSSASLGVEAGSHRSCAIAGEIMFYLSRTGVVAYSGGVPQSIATPFGTDRYKNAVGGSDGAKYYISMQGTDGVWTIFAYDTRTNMWHKEDHKQIINFGWNEEMYFLDSDGRLWLNGNTRTVPEDATQEAAFTSVAEFADFVEAVSNSAQYGANKKGTSKLQVRIELDAGSEVTIDMQFDSDVEWRKVSTLNTTEKKSFYLPIIPRRSDHFRIRFTGTGQWRLHSLVRENYSGSEL